MSWVSGSPSTRSTVSRPRKAASAELNTVMLPLRSSSPAAGTPGQNHELVSPPGSGAAGIHGALTVENTAFVGSTAVDAPRATARAATMVTTSMGMRLTTARPRRRTCPRPRRPGPPRCRGGTVVATTARSAALPSSDADRFQWDHHRHVTGVAGQLDVLGEVDDCSSLAAARPGARSMPAGAGGSPRPGRSPTGRPVRTAQRDAPRRSRSAVRRGRRWPRRRRSGRRTRCRQERLHRRRSIVHRSSKGTARETTPGGTSPDAEPDSSVPGSTAVAPLRSRRTSSADPDGVRSRRPGRR